jgi:hypothetical protein
LHPTKASQDETRNASLAGASRFVPGPSDRLDERPAAGPMAPSVEQHIAEQQTAQTPDENQKICHLTTAHMVGVELPNTCSRNTPGRATASKFVAEAARNSNHSKLVPKLALLCIDQMRGEARHASIVPESWRTANRFVTKLPIVGIRPVLAAGLAGWKLRGRYDCHSWRAARTWRCD